MLFIANTLKLSELNIIYLGNVKEHTRGGIIQLIPPLDVKLKHDKMHAYYSMILNKMQGG